ncbi:hypothetical protein P7K49_021994, partial [Saguinus oedipus]
PDLRVLPQLSPLAAPRPPGPGRARQQEALPLRARLPQLPLPSLAGGGESSFHSAFKFGDLGLAGPPCCG